jgi:quinol monooxygenase YgiN
MDNLEVIARFKVHPGQLEGFTSQVAETLCVTRERDTHTLRCDWFITYDGTECEVHEAFPNEQGLIEHKMNTMEATAVLFRDYAFDHHATIFGEVSQDFIDLVAARMGAAPIVFSFVQGLEQPATVWPLATGTSHLELHAHLKVRPGRLEGFKAQAEEIMRITRAQDTKTLRYDWFINQEGNACEVHEAYVSEAGLVEHNRHVMDARAVLFERYAFDHRMVAFGEVSQQLRDLGTKHAGGLAVFSFLQGLEAAAAV